MEDSKSIPDEINSNESSREIKTENNKEKNVKEFTDFLENASNQDLSAAGVSPGVDDQKSDSNKSLFRRFLNKGFDGISTNPNYKMLALLIILLINLSLFFVIGNMGKVFLKNAGIMG